jgi:hypothetical protein
MSDDPQSRAGQANAFRPEVLKILERLDEVATAQEAELSGPWKVVATAAGFALVRVYEEAGSGDRPEAELADFPAALRFFSVLPSVARAPLVEVDREPSDGWYAVRSEGHAAGRLRVFNDRFVQAAHVAESLARSPLSLAALLVSSGPLAIREVGRILRLRARPGWPRLNSLRDDLTRNPDVPVRDPGLLTREPQHPVRLPGLPVRRPGLWDRGPVLPERGPERPDLDSTLPACGPDLRDRGLEFPVFGPVDLPPLRIAVTGGRIDQKKGELRPFSGRDSPIFPFFSRRAFLPLSDPGANTSKSGVRLAMERQFVLPGGDRECAYFGVDKLSNLPVGSPQTEGMQAETTRQ